mmetsp:Transcript_97356/g.272452  ORF Transcript_97356/g.272452 Transcript_97356/m.272452 type:complete len:479 (+) Transcript_97356:126-1562(+)
MAGAKRFLFATFFCILGLSANGFTPYATSQIRGRNIQHTTIHNGNPLISLYSSKSSDGVCTVQILMSDTGGGHRASANALRDAFDVLYPGKFECDIVDIYTEYGPFWPFNGYVEGYKLMAKYSFLWDLFFQFGETDFGLWLNDCLLSTFCFEPFKDCMNRPSGSTGKRADMVVSVHPLCQDLPLKILSNLDSNGSSRDPNVRTTPFATVVTDLGGAHKTWFNPAVDKCFVPSDVLNEKALSRGLKPSQIVQYGLPIRKGFWSDGASVGKAANQEGASNGLRLQLGLEAELPTVLVVGGGDGMGGIVDIAKALGGKLGESGSSPVYQLVVVCGNNQAAQKELSSQQWGAGVKVVVKGFVNNMDEWMRASDTLVTKAGPGTIAEACICGLPCMLFAYLPGQEEGNVPFVENSGFGKYSGDPKVIADTVSSWLSSPENMESMKASALAAARPSATLDIAADLAEIAFAKKLTKDKVLVTVR